jgi:hypothetical protein
MLLFQSDDLGLKVVVEEKAGVRHAHIVDA